MHTKPDRFAPGSIGRALETEVLVHRRRRLEKVIGVLREQRQSTPSAGLEAALDDFETELIDLRGRLDEETCGPR